MKWRGTHGVLLLLGLVTLLGALAPSISQDALSGKRGRSADALRKQLRDLADTLSARDLEKVTAFAEFIKARRAARTYSQRQDSGDAAPESAEPASEGDPPEAPDAEPTPSSRRRPAARGSK